MFRVIFAILVFTLLGFTASAQSTGLSLADKMQLGTVMDETAFEVLTDGLTITYNNGSDDVYREYYRKGTRRIVIEWTEATDPSQLVCDVGTWYPQGDLICFDWVASGSVCALWVDYNGEYISAIEDDTGNMTGNLEVISTITKNPLYCEVGMVQLQTDIPLSSGG
ncbi:MAG: hypothetical protein JKY31_01025 [Rhodobacteraceae bacterium]|nr:hypothetical protein [Paracoccaceae bacterium]